MSRDVDVAVIGAGHAGLNAIKEIRQVTDSYVLINGGGLGTTCARIGCMPSKVAIHLADRFALRAEFQRYGIEGADALRLSQEKALEHVRDLRDTFVDLVLANTTDEMADELVEGFAEFEDANTLRVDGTRIRAKRIIIATGAASMIPQEWQKQLGDRLFTVETIFEQQSLPKSVAVIGLGAIGTEMGQALHRLGVEVVGIESGDRIVHLQDPIVSQAATEILKRDFPIWLGQPAQLEPVENGVRVRAGAQETLVEKVLVVIGRRPNLAGLHLERTGALLNDKGIPAFDAATRQLWRLPIYIAGDATGGIANLQAAAEQGRIAGYNATHAKPRRYEPRVPMHIVFSEPNIATVGARWSELDQDSVVLAQQRFGPVGRALIMGQNRGLLHLYADRKTGRVLGGAMVGPRCEHLAHLLAWGIQGQLTVEDMLRMPFYHPVIEEALQDGLVHLAKKLQKASQSRSWWARVRPWRRASPDLA